MNTMSKAKILYDEAEKKKGVLIKIKDFQKLMEQLEDLHDIYMAYERTSKKFKPIPYEQIRRELFCNDAKK